MLLYAQVSMVHFFLQPKEFCLTESASLVRGPGRVKKGSVCGTVDQKMPLIKEIELSIDKKIGTDVHYYWIRNFNPIV